MDEISGFDILSEIQRGGQGIVYKAMQKATKRKVALKVLRSGAGATPRERARFEREIDLAANFQHPNIVKVFDSGVAAGSRWYVMEYIHGVALSKYIADVELSVRDTLTLFRKLCAAIAYAHRQGVTHRDLKPANVLVDAEGEPHIVDFGIAKAAGSALALDGSPLTLTGEVLGTLAYASPEQVSGDPTRIDVRSDVYSLGVMLFEALTGEFPYDVAGQVSDVLRNITQAEPVRPSSLRQHLDGDCETIILMALAKDPRRRYQSAGELLRDLEHHLAGEPIRAKRDSPWYVLGKRVRRHRGALAGAVYMLIAVVTVASAARLFGAGQLAGSPGVSSPASGRVVPTTVESDAGPATEEQQASQPDKEHGVYLSHESLDTVLADAERLKDMSGLERAEYFKNLAARTPH